MTITPNWKKEKPGNPPAGSPAAQPPNLSDLDKTQPSMRRPAQEMPLQSRGQMSFTDNIPQPQDSGKPAGSSNSQDDNLVGTMFADRYEILELLGRGGMGAVYKARNRINKNFRAVKLMHAHLVADPQVFRRFQQEATAAARITHPNAISIIDMGMAVDGRPYLIMDFLDGVSLSQLLKYKKKLSIAESLHIFLQMCGALAEAHSHGVIHRDIKPSNVMILDGANGEYVVKVVDFGIAKVFPQEGDPTMKDTTTGELFGSPPYMSPEQCLGKRLDYRSDIYSMGCLMYEVLTGSPPLVGQNALGTMYRQINEMPTPLSDIKDDVRLIQRLDEIISKTLQKNPDQRYQTIMELHADLESAGEFSSKKVAAFSAVGMQLQSMLRAISNGLGSAKKTVVTIMIMALVLCGGGLFIVSPYVFSKDPGAAERVVQWQPLSPLNKTDYANFEKIKAAKNDESYSYLYEHHLSYDDYNPTLVRDSYILGTKYFDNNQFDNAIPQFEDIITEGGLLLAKKQPLRSGAAIAMQQLSESMLRWAQSKIIQSSQKNTKAVDAASPAVAAATDNSGKIDLNNIISSTSGKFVRSDVSAVALGALEYIKQNLSEDVRDVALINAFLGLEEMYGKVPVSRSQALAGKGNDAPSAPLSMEDRFNAALLYWSQNVSKENAQLAAPVLSMYGDHLIEQNKLQEALSVFELSEKFWQLLGERGYSNAAVAEDRRGRLLVRLGKKAEAVECFTKAQQMFYAAAHTDTLDGAKVLFDKADALFACGKSWDAFNVHADAVKIWSSKRPHTGS